MLDLNRVARWTHDVTMVPKLFKIKLYAVASGVFQVDLTHTIRQNTRGVRHAVLGQMRFHRGHIGKRERDMVISAVHINCWWRCSFIFSQMYHIVSANI